jgi:hypothetical protein
MEINQIPSVILPNIWKFCSLVDVMKLRRCSKWFLDIFPDIYTARQLYNCSLGDPSILMKHYNKHYFKSRSEKMKIPIQERKQISYNKLNYSVHTLPELYYWLLAFQAEVGDIWGHFGRIYGYEDEDFEFGRIDAIKFIWCLDLQNWLHKFSCIWYATEKNDLESLKFLLDSKNNFNYELDDLEQCLDLENQLDETRIFLKEKIKYIKENQT